MFDLTGPIYSYRTANRWVLCLLNVREAWRKQPFKDGLYQNQGLVQ